MQKIFTLILTLITSSVMDQQETYDLMTYTAPADWKKEAKENVISYSKVDNVKRTWCRISLYKSTVSKGSLQQDFESEWHELVVKTYAPSSKPEMTPAESENGWDAQGGVAPFEFDGGQSTAMLVTMSGNGRCTSIVILTNTQDYQSQIDRFLESVSMKKMETPKEIKSIPTDNTSTINGPVLESKAPATTSGYAFTTTNFDDGWKSTAQEDWVEVTKGNIKVLLHYPKEGTIFPADPEPLTNTAWNILVAPRYNNLKNYKTAYINTYDRPYLGFGEALDKGTGKEAFVLLFRQGKTGWLEFICPDKNTFIQFFKFDPYDIKWDSETDLLIPLSQMVNYNKFAVAASDFIGRWTNDFSGIQQMYHVYTGQYAGMNINQSSEEFDFKAGNAYNWKLLVVNGMVGSMKANQVKSSGSFSVPNNWQIKFSEIEGKPKTYHAFFSCMKGARLLNLLDAQYPGSGIYTQYGMAK